MQEPMFCAGTEQEANLRNRRNDANNETTVEESNDKVIIDIGIKIGGRLLKTGQWPAFKSVDKPDDGHLPCASPCSEGSGALYFPPL